MASDQARDLRQRGITAAKAGQRDEARKLLQQSVRIEPNNEAAWLWLASVARDSAEREFCLEKVLSINPNNETARKAVDALRASAPAFAEDAPQPSPTVKRLPGAPVTQRPRSTQEILTQAPGVPLPAPEAISAAQREAERILQEGQPQLPALRWTRKRRNRAGENDIVVLRAYIGGAIVGVLALFVVGFLIALQTNEDLRAIVYAPTATPTLTPTVTPTSTPGFTPTPSPTPRISPTPSATPPQSLPTANPYNPPAATSIYPQIFERPVLDAVFILSRGDPARALPTLQAEQRALTRFDPNPYYYAAMAQLAQGELADALRTLEVAEGRLSETPNDNYKPLVDTGFAQVYWAYAQAAQASNNVTELRDYLVQVQQRAESAITGDPRMARAYIVLAQALTLQRDYDRALQVVDRALGVSALSTNTELFMARSDIFFARGECDLASYQAYLALYVDPYTEPAYQRRIACALRRNRPGDAVLTAQTYLYYFPGSTTAWKLLGDARTAEGNFDLAIHAYTQGLAANARDDASAAMLIARAGLYSRARRFSAAREDLTAALNIQADDETRLLRLRAAYAEGRLEIARGDAEALVGSRVIRPAELTLLRAQIMVDAADESGADRSEYLRARSLLANIGAGELSGTLAAVQNEYLARANLALGDYEQALTAIDSALSAGESGRRHFLKGLILEAQDQPDSAIRHYEWVLTWGGVYDFPFREQAMERLSALRSA